MKHQNEISQQSAYISPSNTIAHPQEVVSLLLGLKDIYRGKKMARRKAAPLQLVEVNTVMMVEAVGGWWCCPVAIFCLAREDSRCREAVRSAMSWGSKVWQPLPQEFYHPQLSKHNYFGQKTKLSLENLFSKVELGASLVAQ